MLKLILFMIASWSLSTQAAIILQYHHVSTSTPRSTSVTPAEFRSHLQYLKDHQYQVIGLDQLIAQLSSGQEPAANAVVITFDDGYDNIYLQAHPILQQFDFPYTVFLSPALIDRHEGPVMSWQQIKQLQDDGVIIANHSSYHDHLAKPQANESQADWLKRVKADIELAQQQLEQQLGIKHKWLAYPYGEFSETLEQLVSQSGYIGIGQQSGAVGLASSMTRLPRYPSSGQYAALKHFAPKLKTLAMPVKKALAADPVKGPNPPTLSLQLDLTDLNPKQLNCFSNGEPIEVTWLSADSFAARAKAPLRSSHKRYNCTAPSLSQKGYFYWYSQPWVLD
ncbi:polysaccharide deacetylase family protein [Rheinheimera marina]|uniref:Polysaccharide deacetylase family protein n=1 Tax=Rheinheimera marina TaxID=1774958 RepID=A0ABV9JG42_9GAMM